MLLFTMLLTGLGSLYNALAPDYTQFVLARVITGIGVGADLAIVNTYVGEVAPRRNRARWISVIFIMSSLGALLGIWLGLFLTTSLGAVAARPARSPRPARASTDGWRWMYAVGALLAAIGVLLRLELPESARWLVGRGRLDEADAGRQRHGGRRRQARAAAAGARRRPDRPRDPREQRLGVPALFSEPRLRAPR